MSMPLPTSRRYQGPLASLLAGGLALAASLVLVGPAAAHPRDNTRTKRQYGVELMGVRQSAAGYMLEFRYRVLDAKKARPLFERKAKPMLIDEATKAQLIVPAPGKIGPLRNSDAPKAGRTYWMMFANPGKFVKPGNRVSVVVGDFRADGLVVQ